MPKNATTTPGTNPDWVAVNTALARVAPVADVPLHDRIATFRQDGITYAVTAV